MVKLQSRKIIGVIAVLVMLTSSNLAISYSYAEEYSIEQTPESGHLKTIIAEIIKDGKLIVKVFQVSSSMSMLEIDQVLSKEGSIVGWALVKGESTKSGIVLYNGKTIQTDTKNWQITNDGEISENRSDSKNSDERSVQNQSIEYEVIFEVEEKPQLFSYLLIESMESIDVEVNESRDILQEEILENRTDAIPLLV